MYVCRRVDQRRQVTPRGQQPLDNLEFGLQVPIAETDKEGDRRILLSLEGRKGLSASGRVTMGEIVEYDERSAWVGILNHGAYLTPENAESNEPENV